MNTKTNILRFFFKEAMKYKKLVYVSFFFVPTTLLLERYVAPLLIAYLLDKIQQGTVSLESSMWIIIAFFAIQIYSQVIGYRVILWSMWTVQVRGAASLYRLAYDKLSQHSVEFYSNNFTGSLVSKVGRFTSSFTGFWNMVIYQILFIGISLVATIVGISFFVWQYAVVLLVLAIIFVIAAYFGTKSLRKKHKERSEAYTRISGSLSDTFTNVVATKADAQESREKFLLGEAIDNMVDKEAITRNSFVKITSIYALIISFMRSGALIASVMAVQYGLGGAAIVYICLTYTFNLIEELWSVNSLLRNYYEITGNSEEMIEIINAPASVVDRSKKRLSVKNPDITFDNMSFAHKDYKDKDIAMELFNGFSLHIPKYQKIGVVGASGSGKSTLARLLLRLTDIDEGKIIIDGQDISQVTQKSLRQMISYVPQEPVLFHRSLRDNIGYAKQDATEKEIINAAKKANSLEFIEQLPDGMETLVGERGVKLSGGQRQRVAIARAILKGAPILVLDEATSALDSESEKMIQDALAKLMNNCTSIVIAHRLSTIAKLDRIIVLDKGKIVEDGTHAELLESGGHYASLWKHQSGGFIQD